MSGTDGGPRVVRTQPFAEAVQQLGGVGNAEHADGGRVDGLTAAERQAGRVDGLAHAARRVVAAVWRAHTTHTRGQGRWSGQTVRADNSAVALSHDGRSLTSLINAQ